MNAALEVEGYTPAEPMDDDDWEDDLRWRMRNYWLEKQGHDQNGYLCHLAGSPECLALGHVAPEPDPEYPGEEWDAVPGHESGWDGDWLCRGTQYATACTECEGECMVYDEFDPGALWRAVSKTEEAA